MAEEEETKPTEETEEETAPRSKKKLFLGGGALALVASAWIAASMAAPKKAEYKVFEGPYVTAISADEQTANINDKGRKRFLLLKLNAVYEAFDEAYVTARVADPIYLAQVTDAVLGTASRYDETIMNEDIGEMFLSELQIELDPILFPVHIGKSKVPGGPDPESGLQPGLSIDRSTLRGSLYDHHLTVDSEAMKLRLDEGPPVVFQGDERDLRVENERGRSVYLDVTDLEPGFQGRVLVGVHGRVKRLLKEKFNVQ
jgi:hypothetical protein